MFGIKGGAHLGVVRNWIQRKAWNGENVTWGSLEYLRLHDLTVSDLEHLAQDIRDAVLEEFKVKDTDHEYTYRIFSDDGGAAFQFADTPQEIWRCLFKAKGNIIISIGEATEFRGTADEARVWCLALRERRLPSTS